MRGGGAMIELRDIHFSYSGKSDDPGLRGVNLHVGKGEVVLFCGESGCGKTTLTRLVNGLIPHYYEGALAGTATVCGKSVPDTPLYEQARAVGSVFQNPRSQFFNVDTDSELAFGCENLGFPEAEIRGRTQKAISDFRIQALMRRSIFELSGGEKQKIACAGVDVLRPDVVVLDEPTSNLDMRGIRDLQRIIRNWKAEGRTILIAEHRLYFLRGIADRVLYMRNGRICESFTGYEFFGRPDSFFQERGLRIPSLERLKRRGADSGLKSQSHLVLERFSYSYSSKETVLDVPRAELPDGGVVAVIGPNGAGKTTFVRSLCGLMKRDKSVVKYRGAAWKAGRRLSTCYLVMQDVNHQLFTESVLDEVLMSMKQESREAAEQILASLDLLPLKERHPMSLSGGQKQRVAIASALASGREIIVLDEPTSGLDLCHMQKVAESIRQLQRDGRTVLIVTHDVEFILCCCTHILHMENGRIVGDYPLDADGQEKMMRFFVSDPD